MALLLVVLSATVALAVTVVLWTWWIVALILVPSLQKQPQIEVLVYAAHPIQPSTADDQRGGQQMGGGGTCTDDDLSTRVRTIAEALRRLGQTVNQPGLKAIKALMLMRAGEKQSVAMARVAAGHRTRFDPRTAVV